MDVTRKKRDMLKMYYGHSQEALQDQGAATADPCNINGAHFEPDIYLGKLLKERSLGELMDKETEMVRHIKALDSDMQTLVYENYNKFISATDTIRKMKNDFRKMEDEMDHLATNMAAITEFSGTISNTLQDRRQQITKLAGVHTLLKKLQFLFELPTRLKKCIEMEAYSQAVRYYTKSRKVLHQYQHMPSFQGIQADCQLHVDALREKLRSKFHDKNSCPKELAECVDLLLQLNEPAETLCQDFLSQSVHSSALQPSEHTDILEFVDCGCNGFLSNVCLVIASYNDLFLNRQQDDEQLDAIALKKLVSFVNDLMELYFGYVQRRVLLEKETGDNTILVRALDRFHRRLQAMNKLLPDTDFSRAGTEIVSRAARDRVSHYLHSLQQHYADCLTDIRQNLAAPRMLARPDGNPLSDLLQGLNSSLLDQMKSVLSNLQAFIASDITFAMKPYFRGLFCVQDVRQGLVVAFLEHINAVCIEFCEAPSDKGAVPPALLLILSRLCLDLEQSTISYLLTLVDEQFMLDSSSVVTPASVLTAAARDTAQRLLNHYVRVQGLTISQMLRKSVETRDWLNTIEPRNVRAVMKRVVEDITAMDIQVGQLYEEGIRKERSSDSTKRSLSTVRPSAPTRTNWSYTPSTLDNSLMSNIQKLFSERIEIFSGVEFSKVSVLTGIIKISLKTFLECVRLRTFGRYGMQQIQVDTHYLQLYLWRFVSDENLVHFLLDEIVGSTLHRCLDPVTMETSVVELICERG
ncbi:hypothetical protein CAPTEDRAFT_169961 [Capitella teleta]|uniref:Vacuolar protein sorting-associated protein 51 homolog n=1 Tax=Capitella teleta TaxID=283909 RepID=R7V5S5_CAPTE|nr:hypothetical protein CAPTEDRAFT_169961 [Capitella teleta]|eukprot:ELU14198.1 hypothetical protein CAPTEDRAFT_169961 [Capitella teleta]